MWRVGLLVVVVLLVSGVAWSQAYATTQDTLRQERVIYDPIDFEAVSRQLQLASRPTFWQRLTTRLRSPLFEQTESVNFRPSARLGIRYAPETNLSIGGVVSGEYSTAKGDPTTPLSFVSLSADVSLTGYYGFSLAGDTFLPQGRDRITYSISTSLQPTRFWGLGYYAGSNNVRTKYTRREVDAAVRYLRNVVDDLWLGAALDYTYIKGTSFEQLAEHYLEEANQSARSVSSVGVGLTAIYDRRNNRVNTTKGFYLSLFGEMRPAALADYESNVWHVEALADYYQPVWQGGIVAVDLYAEAWSSAAPWLLWPSVGGSTRMRGYYYGRYAASKMASAQVELRQQIYGPIGGCVWGGSAKIFSSMSSFDFKRLLPNYGVGIRLALGDGTSLRVDYGFGRHSNELIININEAF